MSDVAHAFIASPHYRRGAMFIDTTSGAGSSTMCKPPHVPDDRGNLADLTNDWSLAGFRVPAVAISPYTRAKRRKGGRVSHMNCTHESILKLISYRSGSGRSTSATATRPTSAGASTSPSAASTRRRSPTRPRSRRRRAPSVAAANGPSSTTWSGSRPRGCSSGSATRFRRSPTTRCSATRTGSGARSRWATAAEPAAPRERKRAPVTGPLVPKGRTTSESRRWLVGPSAFKPCRRRLAYLNTRFHH